MTDWSSTPPLVLVAFPALSNHHSLIDKYVAYTYTMNYSCFHPLLFLSPYLQEMSSVLE